MRTMTLEKAIKKRIFDLCIEKNMTIESLCVNCKIDPNTIGSINDGTCEGVTYEAIERICHLLDIDLPEFFESDLFRTLDE